MCLQLKNTRPKTYGQHCVFAITVKMPQLKLHDVRSDRKSKTVAYA